MKTNKKMYTLALALVALATLLILIPSTALAATYTSTITTSPSSGTGNVPLNISFTGKTTLPNVTSWSWNFGDSGSENNTADTQNATHNYTTPGSYTVLLNVSNANNTANTTKKITVNKITPTISIKASKSSGSIPLTVNFTGTTKDATSWAWDFGDTESNTADTKNASHTYNAPGSYVVKLNASNEFANKSATTTIKVTAVAVTVDFSYSVVSASDAGVTVNFTTGKTTGATNFAWNFGDGNTDTGRNVTHTYNASVSRSFTVKLNASNTHASKYSNKTVAIPTIYGYCFNDTNTDGNMSDEVGISGMTINLYGYDGKKAVTATAKTSSTGYFGFSGVKPGTYIMYASFAKDGWIPSSDDAAPTITVANNTGYMKYLGVVKPEI